MKESSPQPLNPHDDTLKVIEQAKLEGKLFSDGDRAKELNMINENSPKITLFPGEHPGEDTLEILHKKNSINNETVKEIHENILLKEFKNYDSLHELRAEERDIHSEYLQQNEVLKKVTEEVLRYKKLIEDSEIVKAMLEKQFSLEKKRKIQLQEALYQKKYTSLYSEDKIKKEMDKTFNGKVAFILSKIPFLKDTLQIPYREQLAKKEQDALGEAENITFQRLTNSLEEINKLRIEFSRLGEIMKEKNKIIKELLESEIPIEDRIKIITEGIKASSETEDPLYHNSLN